MGDLGRICYAPGGAAPGSLCYGAGNEPRLVYKVQRPGSCTVQVDWQPQTWICQTYNVEHAITFNCSGAFSSGSGNVARAASASSVVFTLSNIQGPATFAISFYCNSSCSTTENPGVNVNFVAAQSGAVPLVDTDVPCPTNLEGAGTMNLVFDANGKLAEMHK